MDIGIGSALPRIEDERLLRGKGHYIDDLVLPHMVHAAVHRSSHAHARIRSVSTEAARRAPGVLCVLTGADWRAAGLGNLPVPRPRRKRRDGSTMFLPEFPPLAMNTVRWVGEPIAFIVAETRHQALDAAELIEVDYQPLPAVTRPDEAIGEGAPQLHDGCANNICFVHLLGDKREADEAIAGADHVVTHRFTINRVTAATTEARGCVGHYDSGDSRYTIYSTLQRPHAFRFNVSRVLNVPETDVRVVAGDVGGSFGMKSAVYHEVPLVLWTSKMLGRPVKWISSRAEAFVSDAHGRDLVTEASLALDRMGRFVGMRVRNVVALGAYAQGGSDGAPTANLGTLAGVYTTPAIHVDVTTVFTNTNPIRSYRGNGRPEAAYVIERLIDMAADELGMDPIELRRKNLIAREALPYTTPLSFTYDCGAFDRNMDMVLEMADCAGFAERRREAGRRGKLLGFGFSNSIEKAASPGYEGMEVRFDRSGSATILSGAFSQGQGHETSFVQLACQRLGLTPDDIRYVSGDTDKVFFGEGTGGSRTATIAGAALNFALEKIIDKGRRLASHVLGAPPEDIEFRDGVYATPLTNQTLSIRDVARALGAARDLPPGMEPGLTATHVYQNDVYNFPNGSHACEVEVDPETGTVDVVRYNVVDDVGTILNPLLLKGQIRGGIAQGLGQVLCEDIIYDAQGQLLTGSFMDYAMPRATDFSRIAVKSNPVPTKSNPLGVKGAGEAGTVGALPAIANAIVDALSELGVRHVPMPATPERIWRAIANARQRETG
jgi:carbon-monoxide dehydrogenase large subunit